MVEKDFDANGFAGVNLNSDPGTDEKNDQNDTLGMDGVDIELQDYAQAQAPAHDNGQAAAQQQSSQVRREESKTQSMLQPREPSKFEQWCPWLTLQPLVPYFQVNSKTVGQRVRSSLIPFNRRFQPQYNENPDLYGPFWILTTLVLVLFVAGNIERYSRHAEEAEEDAEFEYNYHLIPVAMFVLYGIGLGLPLLVKCLVTTYGVSQNPTPLVNAVGIYGYSFSSFILTTLLCAIPIDWLQWLLISYAALTSLSFLILTYWDDFKTSLEPKYRWAIIFFMCAVQLTLLILFKVYFFKHV